MLRVGIKMGTEEVEQMVGIYMDKVKTETINSDKKEQNWQMVSFEDFCN